MDILTTFLRRGENGDVGEMTHADFAALVKFITDAIQRGEVTQDNVFSGVLAPLFALSNRFREEYYGRGVYKRWLIEFTNYCTNDCLYCGIRKSNANAARFRLTKEQILAACKVGHDLGYNTYVLQGGEDPYYTDDVMCDIVAEVRAAYPRAAITLSLGERSRDSYARLYEAGATRYLLRHETADETHYSRLHPVGMSLSNRKACLYTLKDIGYQVGCGFMVCSPFQTAETLAADLMFIRELRPHMVGIGPFIEHADTPFAGFNTADSNTKLLLTVALLAVIRVMLPKVLLPATTALGTVAPQGREFGIRAGGNVVMPNLSPRDTREKYLLYDGKICTGDEAAECAACMKRRMMSIGDSLVDLRGDYFDLQ